MTGVRGRFVDAGYAAGWQLARVLPETVTRFVFQSGADVAAWRPGHSTRQLRRNLARVVPQAGGAELDWLVRQALRSYARYWCEAFRLPAMDHGAVHRAVDAAIRGVEHLDAALAAGRGAVLALPHSGNWDAAGVWLVRQVGTFTTVAERLRPESLYQRFVAYRESLGFEILPLTGGVEPVASALARRLRSNGVVCLVADRDLSSSGVPVTFFGEQARMPGGPAYLAARTGAALVPAGCWNTPDGWGVGFHPPVDVARNGIRGATQALADAFAGDVAAHPADWHMLQPLWLADLPAARRAALAERAPKHARMTERAVAQGAARPIEGTSEGGEGP
jgi:phosphatidylinositol dimannoside acyltransferase